MILTPARLLQRMSPELARMGHAGGADRCPQFEVERTQSGRRLWAAFVKVFGCRPMTVVPHAAGAGVRKPPGEETAGGVAGSCRALELRGLERCAWSQGQMIFSGCRPRRCAQLGRSGTNIAKWGKYL